MDNNVPQNATQNNNPKIWKIYKIISKIDASTVYIGSTIQKSLYQRLYSHVSDTRYCPNTKKNMWIIKNNYSLDIIQINTANNKEDALRSEESEILKHISEGYEVLNIQLPTNGKIILPRTNMLLPNTPLIRINRTKLL
jgi:hypothetical protein